MHRYAVLGFMLIPGSKSIWMLNVVIKNAFSLDISIDISIRL